nr:immunoglobulin heavy chain junction region [Macaca mulatta]MOV91982.1 immunoglobulin heavy chain junction region [Macaca mulatta]
CTRGAHFNLWTGPFDFW